MSAISREIISYIYLALCILIRAMLPVVSKKMLVELDNVQILFYSTILSSFVMALILLFEKKITVFKKYSINDYLIMCFLGIFGAYLFYILLYQAFALTTAQEGFILNFTWPIMIVVLSFLILKETITLRKIIAILISFLGVVVIVTKGNLFSLKFTSLSGDILALGAAFSFAIFSVLGKRYIFDKTISMFIFSLSGLVFATLTLFILSTFKIPSMTVLPWLIYNGVFINGLSFLFWLKSVEHGDINLLSNIAYVTPFISLIYILIFLKEEILLSSVIGLIIIISGIFVQSYRSKIKS